MQMTINDLKDILPELHGRNSAYIIGSGKSMDWVDPDFFRSQFVIGVNNMYKHFPCAYTLIRHHHIAQDAIDAGQQVVVSRRDCCHQEKRVAKFNGTYYVYDHVHLKSDEIDFRVWGSRNHLVIGNSPVIDAMSFAVHLGCKNIILCGCDMGLINGEPNFTEYNQDAPQEKFTPEIQRHHSVRSGHLHRLMRDELKKRGVNVYALNPFIGFDLEGNDYDRESIVTADHLRVIT